MAELEKLVVKIEADTSSFNKEIDKAIDKVSEIDRQGSKKDLKLFDLNDSIKTLKQQASNIHSAINDALTFSGNYTKAGGNELKEYFSKQLKEAYDTASSAMKKGDESLFKLMNNFGADSKITIDYGNTKDELGNYLQSLKKSLGELDNIGDPLLVPGGLASIQNALQNINGPMETFDFNNLKKQITELINERNKLKAELKKPLISEDENVKVIEKIQDIDSNIRELIKSFAKLRGISTDAVHAMLGSPSGSSVTPTNYRDKQDKRARLKFNFAQITAGFFGIRSIYFLVKRIVSQNDQLTQSINNAIQAIGSALEPFLNFIASLIQGLAKMLGYVKKNTDRFLASFDELNKLSVKDTKISPAKEAWDSLSTAGKIGTIAVLGTLVGNIISKLVKFFKSKAFLKFFLAIKAGLTKVLEIIKIIGAWIASHAALIGGIIAAISGVVIAIKGVIDYLNDPSWNNFGNTLLGIALAVAGVALAIGAWPVAIAAAVVAVVGLLSKFWEPINAFFNNISTKLHEVMNEGNLVVRAILGVVVGIWDSIWTLLKSVVTSIRQIFDGIILIFKGDFKEGFISIGKGIVNALIGILNTLIHGLNGIVSPIRALIVAIGKVIGKSWTMDTIAIPTIPYLAKGGVVDQPTVAMIGEAGREIVTPEKLLTNIITSSNGELASVYAQIGRQIVEAINNKDLDIKIGDDVIAKSAARGNSSYYKMTGKNLLGGTI